MPWSPTVAPPRQRYDDVWCFDENVVIALNSSGEILKTTNGGANWAKKFQTPLIPPLNRAVYLRCLAFAGASNGWAGTVTRDHRLFKTVDGGESWAPAGPLPLRAPDKICGLYAASKDVIYGSGTNDPSDGAAMVKTTDGGANWTAIDMSAHASNLIDVYFRDELDGFVVGGVTKDPNPQYGNVRPVILHTQDGASTWRDCLEDMRSEFSDGTWGWKIQFLNNSLGYVSLENFTKALIVKTTDGGKTWRKIDVADNENLEGIGFLDDFVGWVGGWGTTSFTEDGGENWVNAAEIGDVINRFRFFGTPIRFGYSSGRTVYRFSPQQVVAAAPPAPPRSLIRSPADLVYGDAEVPICIDVPVGAKQVSIQIWNRFAKEVRVLMNESAPASGARVVRWDRKDEKGQAVTPGSYIYRVTIDDGAESQVITLK